MEKFYLINIRKSDFSFSFTNNIKFKLEEKYEYFKDIYEFECKNIELLKKKIRKYYVGIKFNGDIFEIDIELFKSILFDIKNFVMRINYTNTCNTCNICQISFKTRDTFFKHLDTQKHLLNYNNTLDLHNNKKEITDIKNEIIELKKYIDDLKLSIKNITSMLTSKINYNALGHEYKTYIFDKNIIDFLKQENNFMTLLIKYIHFNNKYPQNQNIVFKDNDKLTIFDGNSWIDKKTDKIIFEMIESNLDFVIDKIEDSKIRKKDKEIENYELHLNTFIAKYNENEFKTNVINEIKTLIKNPLYTPIKNKVKFT